LNKAIYILGILTILSTSISQIDYTKNTKLESVKSCPLKKGVLSSGQEARNAYRKNMSTLILESSRNESEKYSVERLKI
tara:strand:- start:1806 stop:2042 length:237 start_codon:yes stop_codon:yes gene_type:complete